MIECVKVNKLLIVPHKDVISEVPSNVSPLVSEGLWGGWRRTRR